MSTSRRFPYLTLLLLIVPIVYVATLARATVWGDPTEYTFVAHVLGIAHPPGYAFYTLLAKLTQLVVPFGSIAWRTHLLSAVTVTVAALLIYGSVSAIGRAVVRVVHPAGLPAWLDLPAVAGVFAALSAGAAADIWQHGIHANPHIVTGTFLVANLFFLTRWGIASRAGAPRADRWLYVFSLSAGLGVTHHPLTVFGFAAYALFIILVRPAIWRDWRTILKMVAWAAVGLAVWLYFPIRSAMDPPFGPSTMNTLSGFLDHVLARGLSESLPFFSLADLPGRLVVFWTLLRLQYTLPVIALAFVGLVRLAAGRAAPASLNPRHLAVLYGLALLSILAFVLNLRAQDIMAYLLGPFMIIALLAGTGLLAFMEAVARRAPPPAMWALLVGAAFLVGPLWQLAANYPRISLQEYAAAEQYVAEVFNRFDGSDEAAVLLNDWEHMTPLWYSQFVDERWPDERDVRPVLVSTAQPWLESVFAYLPGGPVYLSNYRREIVAAGFRLRPDGSLYQVVEPGDASIPATLSPAAVTGGAIEIVGYDLPQTAAAPGSFIPLTLAMRAPAGTSDYYVPVVHVGDLTFSFTTDSHLITPLWEPGEVIVERFDFALPHDLPSGDYPVTVGLKNLSTDVESDLALPVGQLSVAGPPLGEVQRDLLANFRQRVGLLAATAAGERRSRAPWSDPLVARPGETIGLTLEWLALAPAEESYTVFVHLIDPENRPLVALDYTPLGGSAPTHLWIPKWLVGQRMLDPYRLVIPPDIAPGTYYIEVGLYEMVSGRRLHMADEVGNLIGDRLILGPIVVPGN